MTPVREKVHEIVRRARKSISLHYRRPSEHKIISKPSSWGKLPTQALVQILAHCDLHDIYNLMRSCRSLHQRIRNCESAIARAYLHHRRLQNTFNAEADHEISSSPGDDLSFIAELFPPPPPHYSNSIDHQPGYSFGYMADLTHCWRICIRLSYSLAEHVVLQHLQTDPVAKPLWSSSKTERELVYSKAVGRLQARLLPPIAYLILFLETTATITGTSNPHQSLQTQESILQQPPFTSTHVLLSAHHTMHLLCTTVRHMMSPQIPPSSTEHWLSLLLTTSTLERILDFFRAAADDESAAKSPTNAANTPVHVHVPHTHTRTPSNQQPTWTKRMEFMWRMRRDWEEYISSRGDRVLAPPVLDAMWFEAARRELGRRGAIPHRCEGDVPVLLGSVIVMRCGLCEEDDR